MTSAARVFQKEEQSSIHENIIPADVREGEVVKAKVKSLDPQYFFNERLRVWRISPLGVELVVENEQVLPKGIAIELEIQFGMQKTVLTGLIVDSIVSERDKKIAHVRLIPKPVERIDGAERRVSSRWMCSEQFFPTAVASNPARFNDFVYFKIRDISYGGFKMTTSLRNKFIVPGIAFDCIVNFPMISQVNMRLTVKNIRVEFEGGNEVLSLGMSFDTKNRLLVQTVGQYLMQFGTVQSLKEMQEAGFSIHKISNVVSFSYVRSKEEFDEVLKLRLEAYQQAGKVSDTKTASDMADHFDARSRIVIGYYKSEIVCSARMIFHQVGDTMEQEKFVKWPTHLPRPDEVLEVMRACTKPDFRGSDLLVGMLRQITITIAQAKKNWIVICASDEMVGFYEKIGFKKVDLSYEHTGLNNRVHHVMIANFLDAMAGRTVGPIYWNLVWADSMEYLSQFELVQVDPFMQIRMTIYRWFAPIARFFYTRKIRKFESSKQLKPDQNN
jgi:predicted GNAT family N-acyltransferase